MKNQELSIIIPVYNGQDYILNCISSILGQKGAEKYEIIIVDDGSRDKTPKILKALAKDNKNIRVITQKNAGVSVARNTGIEASNGKYITFVDCDDMVGLRKEAFDKYFNPIIAYKHTGCLSTTKTYRLPFELKPEYFTDDYFTNLLSAAFDTGADVVLGGKITINLDMSYLSRQTFDKNHVYGQNPDDKNTVLRYANIRETANVALYRRDNLDTHNLRFMSNMHLDEDILFCMLATLYAEKVATTKDVTYLYNRHIKSLSNLSGYHETLQRYSIAYIQRFSYLLNELDKSTEYSKLFSYWIKYYSKQGLQFPSFANEFPPDDCYYWCEKQECKDCHIAQTMRKNFEANIQRYSVEKPVKTR